MRVRARVRVRVLVTSVCVRASVRVLVTSVCVFARRGGGKSCRAATAFSIITRFTAVARFLTGCVLNSGTSQILRDVCRCRHKRRPLPQRKKFLYTLQKV